MANSPLTLVSLDGSNDPDTGDIYAGLDRFGRVKDVRWRNVSGNSDLSRVQYGYDRASSRVWRQNPSDTAAHHDWQYAYDGLHRLEDAVRGTLDFSGPQPSTLDPQQAQCWTLDATGNWRGFRQADAGGGSPWDLVQQRLGSPVNEILGITNTVGSPWAQPAYDPAGNMTTIPQPNDPAEEYTATYDAWNRLVKLVDPATDETVQENQYDARTFRTVTKSYAGGTLAETRHAYYSDGWRCLEERLGTNPDAASANRQFVWGRRYLDDLVLRDRTTTGPLDERLYALQDGNWNVTAVVDNAGDVQERYEYDPYGTLAVMEADFTPQAASSFAWETIYCGYRFDALTGMYPVRFRVLIPLLGWAQRDSLEYVDSMTLYGYVGSSPLTWLDPLGQRIGGGGVPPGWGTKPVTDFPALPLQPYIFPVQQPVLPLSPRFNPLPPGPAQHGWRPLPGTPEWNEWVRREWEFYNRSQPLLPISPPAWSVPFQPQICPTPRLSLPSPSQPSTKSPAGNPVIGPTAGAGASTTGGPPPPPRLTYGLPSPQDDCSPCVPPVGTVSYQLHTAAADNKPHAGMSNHYHWFVMHQTPFPACRCFWVRNAIDPTDASLGPFFGTVPWSKASGGGPE